LDKIFFGYRGLLLRIGFAISIVVVAIDSD